MHVSFLIAAAIFLLHVRVRTIHLIHFDVFENLREAACETPYCIVLFLDASAKICQLN